MGRKRTIDPEAIMTAIEAVVLQHGVAGLSIDAVAREAGISKSSVLYDFKDKSALLAAYVARKIEAKQALIRARMAAAEGPDALLRAIIANAAAKAPTEQEVSVAMVISASTEGSDACRCAMRGAIAEEIAKVTQDATSPREAMLAYLAVHGLMCMEYFGFHRFDPETRARILADIDQLVRTAAPTLI